MENEWSKVKLVDIIQFNPKESIKKGEIAKKVAMEKLEPFTRKISGFEEAKFTSGTKFRNGDTLLARITPCLENGKTAQVDILDKDEIGFGSTEYIVLREKLGITDNDFIYYLSISPEFRNVAIKAMNGSSGRQRVQKDVLENSEFLLPPLDEQKAIAKILSDLDEKIGVNNKINKKLEEMVQAIFKQWFVDFEFPNEDGKPYKSSGGEMVESELGMIPKGWKVVEIDDITMLNRRGFSPKYSESGIKVINQRCVRNHNLVDEAIQYHDLSQKKVPDEVFLKSKDILINSMGVGTLGRVAQRSLISEKSIVHSCITILRANEDKINPYILGRYIISMESELEQLGTGTTGQTSLNNKVLGKQKMVVAPMSVQNKIADTLKTISINIDSKLIENIKLTNLRDTLLPKLMSGEIRVPMD
ncbi:restriction endonuclease subunit S [Clostridium saudiense]|uniref:restriction endonuclease subunit S n=1 Tax=Clostridium saudiense TaxID=1414720 RepID=UPI0004BC908B|nr:restriction endonuclease subunit S [Clostridium saudiense]